ncbi:MAG: hypothetical protein JXR78_03395 [Victivallales bacterium]|nr:hypothetical protein [Victivallales bacterium]
MMNDNYVDVSNGLGIPFGGIGTGYSVFGQYGFTAVNYDSVPDEIMYIGQKNLAWTSKPDQEAQWAFAIKSGNRTIVLQKEVPSWLPDAEAISGFQAHAHLPKGHFGFQIKDLCLQLSMTAFSPMVPHDLENSTIPVQIFDFTVKNTSHSQTDFTIELVHAKPSWKSNNGLAVWSDPHGDIAMGCDGGSSGHNSVYKDISSKPDREAQIRFCIGWNYPNFRTPSPNARKHYQRYYTRRFKDAASVVSYAQKKADDWSFAIDQWHNSYDVPAEFHRLWFSSLSSVITSTMMSADPFFFEIETPHHWVNTMDVSVYSSWLYLINWPELEKMDMDQYFSAIPTSGSLKGFVWHSMWDDACHYVEEPTFLNRIYRDYLWFNERNWLDGALTHAENAADFVYSQDNYKDLIVSNHGNQSYDVWKMPGISSYVNSAWVYGLYSLEKMALTAGKDVNIKDYPVKDLKDRAVASFNEILWNESGYWNCFYRTPEADKGSVPESVFSDQLFGRWAVSLDTGVNSVLPEENIKKALKKIYQHNMVKDGNFKGWVNGRLPDGSTDDSGSHSKVFWVCAQLDLGSLLGEYDFEEESLDVFRSFEGSLKNNHLAVGEWNQSLRMDGKTERLREEHGKDTPRFPSYPRYKCCWEYLIRILGVKFDEKHLFLSPFKTISYSFSNIILGGVTLTVNVQRGWDKAVLDDTGVSGDIRIPRDEQHHHVQFINSNI